MSSALLGQLVKLNKKKAKTKDRLKLYCFAPTLLRRLPDQPA